MSGEPVAVVLAVGLAALSSALLVAAPPRIRAGPSRSRGAVQPVLATVAVATGVLVLWSWVSLHTFVLVVLLGASALGVARVLHRRRAARSADERADLVLAVCEAMASDLASGQPPLLSLDRAAAEWPELAPVSTAGRMGADVPAALRELAARPGARQLRTLAATWQVAHETGSGLAAAIRQAADAIRADRRTARLVAAELAAAHATARMLAALPFGVLLLGAGVGGDPIGFLVATTPGLICLAVGLGLSFSGLLWLDRIADRVLGR